MEPSRRMTQIVMKTRLLEVVVLLKRRVVREPADPVGTGFNIVLVLF